MKLRQIMTKEVVRIHPEEPAAVAARWLQRYNVGILPVTGSDGRLYGVVTDRDLVVRCMAPGKNPGSMRVKDVMTGSVITAHPDMEVKQVSELMASYQIRRVPVVEKERLCGMVSLADLANCADTEYEALQALLHISDHVSKRP